MSNRTDIVVETDNAEGQVLLSASRVYDLTEDKTQDTINSEVRNTLSDIKSFYENKNIKFVAGVARYTNGQWALLDDSTHNPMNMTIASGQTDPSSFRINHDVGAIKVLSLVCAPDESYAAQGVICGASVGLDYSIIDVNVPCVKNSAITNGDGPSVYTHVSALAGSIDFVSSITEMSHAALGTYLKINFISSAQGNEMLNLFSTNEYEWRILGYTYESMNVQPYLNGTKQTLPLAQGKVSFSIMKDGYGGIKSYYDHNNSNIWILGIFETA